MVDGAVPSLRMPASTLGQLALPEEPSLRVFPYTGSFRVLKEWLKVAVKARSPGITGKGVSPFLFSFAMWVSLGGREFSF